MGEEQKEAGGHPQTLGRDESLHSLAIPAKAGIQRQAKPADSISIPAFDPAVSGEERRSLEDAED